MNETTGNAETNPETQTGTKTPKGDRDGKVEPEESKES